MLCKILLFVVLNMTNGYTFTHRNEIYKDLRKKKHFNINCYRDVNYNQYN